MGFASTARAIFSPRPPRAFRYSTPKVSIWLTLMPPTTCRLKTAASPEKARLSLCARPRRRLPHPHGECGNQGPGKIAQRLPRPAEAQRPTCRLRLRWVRLVTHRRSSAATTPARARVFDTKGNRLADINYCPHKLPSENCGFGGSDKYGLYIIGRGVVFRIKTMPEGYKSQGK